MNKRLAHSLTGLYPRAWRARYGEEFQALLESYPNNVRALCDVVGWAIYERLFYVGGFNMNPDQQSLALMAYAWLAAVAAGANFYWTVADTPMATAMRSHSTLFALWTLIQVGALLAFAAVVIVGLPTFVTVARTAHSARRWGVVGRLAAPLIAAVVTLLWMAAAAMWTGGHWVPTPRDVTGDWTAPSEWPPQMTRWTLSMVTFVLLVVGLIGSAVSVNQVIHRADVSVRRRLLTAPSLILAGSTSLMAAAVVARRQPTHWVCPAHPDHVDDHPASVVCGARRGAARLNRAPRRQLDASVGVTGEPWLHLCRQVVALYLRVSFLGRCPPWRWRRVARIGYLL